MDKQVFKVGDKVIVNEPRIPAGSVGSISEVEHGIYLVDVEGWTGGHNGVDGEGRADSGSFWWCTTQDLTLVSEDTPASRREVQVGDTVSVSEDYRGWQFASERYAPKTNGIVVAIQPNQMDILVEFHGWTDGHNGPDKWTEGPRWYIPVQYLTVIPLLEAPVEPEVSNPSPVVALYPSDLLILKHLRARGSISPMEALVSHGCARLAPRIFNLRKAGHEITTELLTDEGGHRYSRYTLQKEAA